MLVAIKKYKFHTIKIKFCRFIIKLGKFKKRIYLTIIVISRIFSIVYTKEK